MKFIYIGKPPSEPALLALWWGWSSVLYANGLVVEQWKVHGMSGSLGPKVFWNGRVRVRGRSTT